MPKYPLTERQKDLLRALAPRLENGEIGTECLIAHAYSRISHVAFVGGDAKSVSDIWQNVRQSDFDKFVEIGFFRQKDSTKYTLNEYLIPEAVKNDFEVCDWRKQEQANQYYFPGDFRGSVLNIGSILTDVRQSIGSIPNMDDDTKTELASLLDELQQELANAPEEYMDDAEAIVESAKTAIEQLNRDKPNKTMLRISADGLKKAAGNIADILPKVALTAGKIVKVLVPLM